MKNIESKIKAIKENYVSAETSVDISNYVELLRSSDPSFMRWLLDAPDVNDFGSNCTDEQEFMFTRFLELVSEKRSDISLGGHLMSDEFTY